LTNKKKWLIKKKKCLNYTAWTINNCQDIFFILNIDICLSRVNINILILTFVFKRKIKLYKSSLSILIFVTKDTLYIIAINKHKTYKSIFFIIKEILIRMIIKEDLKKIHWHQFSRPFFFPWFITIYINNRTNKSNFYFVFCLSILGHI